MYPPQNSSSEVDVNSLTVVDTNGVNGTAGENVNVQAMFDKITDYIMNKVVMTDKFQTNLAKYLSTTKATVKGKYALDAYAFSSSDSGTWKTYSVKTTSAVTLASNVPTKIAICGATLGAPKSVIAYFTTASFLTVVLNYSLVVNNNTIIIIATNFNTSSVSIPASTSITVQVLT